MFAGWRALAFGLTTLALPLDAGPPDPPVRGTIVDATGAPVEGASLRAFALEPSESDAPLAEATSSASGDFELATLEAGALRLVVTHPDFLPYSSAVDTGPPRPDLRLVLSRGARIEGKATLRHGTPLSGLPVEVIGQEDSRAVTREDGTFTIERVPPGRMAGVRVTDATGTVQVAYGGLGPREPGQTIRGGETASIEVHTDVVRVRGRLTRAGVPLGRVLLRPDEGWQQLRQALPASAAPGTGRTADRRRPGEAMTEADGSFELFRPPGRVGYLIEELEGGRFYGRRGIDFPKSDDSTLDIELPAADTVRGLVIDKESGRGVPAVVQVRPQAGRLPDGETRWWRLADAEGRFQFELEPGEYFVGTVHPTYAPAEQGFTHSGPTSGLTLELERTPSIAGQVLDTAGGDLRGLVVTARGEDGRDVGNSAVEDDGRFRIFGLQAKRYNLLVGSPETGWDMLPAVEVGAEDVTLTLRPPGQIHLVVLSPDGQPIPSAFATLRTIAGVVVAVHTPIGNQVADMAGRLELVVPAGTLEIAVVSQLYFGSLTIAVAPGASLTSSLTLSEPSGPSRDDD